MRNFAYFQKPIGECSDKELIGFLILFLNGADPSDPYDIRLYEEFEAEVPNRSKEFQSKVEHLKNVI